jgi:hypothetical protein
MTAMRRVRQWAEDNGHAAARAGPSGALRLVPWCEHVGSFAADPDEYIARVVAFLEASLPDPRLAEPDRQFSPAAYRRGSAEVRSR